MSPRSDQPDRTDALAHITPEGHVDDVGCPCGPMVHPVAGLTHSLVADESPVVELPVEPGLAALAWHDVTCPEGPDCRDRPFHAASGAVANTGILDRFLARLGALQPSPAARDRYWLCGDDCTTDCGACKGTGCHAARVDENPYMLENTPEEFERVSRIAAERHRDEADRIAARVGDPAADGEVGRLVAAEARVRAGLALADELERRVVPRSFHPAGTHSDGASQAFAEAAERLRAALSAPLAGQHTTDEQEQSR